jgi:hypothetical protein
MKVNEIKARPAPSPPPPSDIGAAPSGPPPPAIAPESPSSAPVSPERDPAELSLSGHEHLQKQYATLQDTGAELSLQDFMDRLGLGRCGWVHGVLLPCHSLVARTHTCPPRRPPALRAPSSTADAPNRPSPPTCTRPHTTPPPLPAPPTPPDTLDT